MYSSALNHYGHYLKEYPLEDSPIFDDCLRMNSEAQRLVKIRVKQNKFRKALFDLNPYCAVTGLQQSQFLIASHIKPWSLSNDHERVDPYNGFLLSPNFDCLFDAGYIGFQANGTILVSKYMTRESQDFFNIPNQIKTPLSNQHKSYLEFHLEEIFQK